MINKNYIVEKSSNIIKFTNKIRKSISSNVVEKSKIKDNIDQQWDIFSHNDFIISKGDKIYVVDKEFLSSIEEHIEQIIDKNLSFSKTSYKKLSLNEYETLINYYQESFYFSKNYYNKFLYRIGIAKAELAYGKIDEALLMSNVISNEIIYLENISKVKSQDILNKNKILKSIILVHKFIINNSHNLKILQQAQKILNSADSANLNKKDLEHKVKTQFYINQFFNTQPDISLNSIQKRKLLNILKKSIIIEQAYFQENHYFLYFQNKSSLHLANDFFSSLIETTILDIDYKALKILIISTNKHTQSIINEKLENYDNKEQLSLFEYSEKNNLDNKENNKNAIDLLSNTELLNYNNKDYEISLFFNNNEYLAQQFNNSISNRKDCSIKYLIEKDMIKLNIETSNTLILKILKDYKEQNQHTNLNNIIETQINKISFFNKIIAIFLRNFNKYF